MTVLWMIAAWAMPATDLDEALAAAGATVERGDQLWTVIVGGRPLIFPAPRTEAERSALAALVTSLASGLDLVPTAPLPTPPPPPPAPRPARPEPAEAVAERPAPVPEPPPTLVVLVLPPEPAAPPAPPPPALAPVPLPVEPTESARRFQLDPWIGGELVARPGMSSSGGLAFGATTRGAGGVGLRIGARAPRSVTVGGPSELVEGLADAEVWGSVGPHFAVALSAGVSARLYTAGAVVAGAHAIPRASTAVWFPIETGGVRLTFVVSGELDLAPTDIGSVDGPIEVLPPLAIRTEARIGPAK